MWCVGVCLVKPSFSPVGNGYTVRKFTNQFDIDICVFQLVKRPRKIPVGIRAPSPDDRVFSGDYNDDYDYDDRHSVYSAGPPPRDASLERRGGGYGGEREGRRGERDHTPDRAYRRDGSRGRHLDRERSPDPRYRSDRTLDRDMGRERDHSPNYGGGGGYRDHEPSPDRRFRSERALDRDHNSPDRRYRSERTLDRDHSPDRRYRSERTLDREPSPDRRYRSEHMLDRSHSPAGSYAGRERAPSDISEHQRRGPPEPMKRSASREQLDHRPSPPTRQRGPQPPLDPPLSVLLLKNRPSEGTVHYAFQRDIMQSQS